jgi:hypothetical protein
MRKKTQRERKGKIKNVIYSRGREDTEQNNSHTCIATYVERNHHALGGGLQNVVGTNCELPCIAVSSRKESAAKKIKAVSVHNYAKRHDAGGMAV